MALNPSVTTLSGLAADRPANPGFTGVIYYATDTNTTTVWDGAAWQALGGGTSGATGPPGQIGEDGEEGVQGPPGIAGPAGADGASGGTGSQGPVGPAVFLVGDGEPGESGPPGPAGVAGSAGSTGAQGPTGPAVFLSAEEIEGPTGPPGPAGAAGAPGGSSLTKIAGSSGAVGADETWLVLTANSGDITGITPVVVMTITGLGAGRYSMKCMLIYQTTALTTGIDVSVNHTGTTTQWLMEHRFESTGSTATTAAASESAVGATGNIYESQGQRTKNSTIGVGTVSVDVTNSDIMSIIEGFFVVSVSGDLQIKLAAEAALLVCRAMQGSSIVLRKFS